MAFDHIIVANHTYVMSQLQSMSNGHQWEDERA